MKFECPIHKTKEFIVERVCTQIEDWDTFVCIDCIPNHNLKSDFRRWLSSSGSPLDSLIKRKIKSGQTESYYCDDGNCFWGESSFYSKIVYVDIHPSLIELSCSGYSKLVIWNKKKVITKEVSLSILDKDAIEILTNPNIINHIYKNQKGIY